jgi:hypothetical protein
LRRAPDAPQSRGERRRAAQAENPMFHATSKD